MTETMQAEVAEALTDEEVAGRVKLILLYARRALAMVGDAAKMGLSVSGLTAVHGLPAVVFDALPGGPVTEWRTATRGLYWCRTILTADTDAFSAFTYEKPGLPVANVVTEAK